MAGIRNPKVKVGQICWTAGGYHNNLSFRLVKITTVKTGRLKSGECRIVVKLVNPTEIDMIALGKSVSFGVLSDFWLFTSPSDWREGFEGTPESITQPILEKKPAVCPSCNSKVIAKMKFCGECGEKL